MNPNSIVMEGVVELSSEDNGMALIAEDLLHETAEPRMFCRLQSWDEDKKHLLLRSLEGKRVRVTVEVI